MVGRREPTLCSLAKEHQGWTNGSLGLEWRYKSDRACVLAPRMRVDGDVCCGPNGRGRQRERRFGTSRIGRFECSADESRSRAS